MPSQDAAIIDPIREALAQDKPEVAVTILSRETLDPPAVRRLFGPLSADDGAALIAPLSPSRAGELLLWLPPAQAAPILELVDAGAGARALLTLPSDERTDLLARVNPEAREALRAQFPAAERDNAARLLRYPPETAGGLMETELLAYPAATTVRDVIRDIRANQERYARIGVQYLYVVDEGRRLVGVSPLRDLLLAPEDSPLGSVQRTTASFVKDTATMDQLADLFAGSPFHGLPVVNEEGVLLGVVNRDDVTEAEQHHTEEQYRVSQGIVGGEELRSMPVFMRLGRRTAWLGVNLVLSLGGAAIVAFNRGTIAKALVVAAVLPVISATSGNAAMQAAAVSIRELTLGVIEPSSWRRVLVHEAVLAAMMSAPLGLAVAALARWWGANPGIGVAVGVAMAVNTIIAVGIGALCPLGLRRLRMDPALASGPISTTLADVTGFLLTLGLVAGVA